MINLKQNFKNVFLVRVCMSDFIENRDVVKIYSGLSLAIMISIPVQVSFIYLIVLGFGYWHTVVKKKENYLLLSLRVNKYITRAVLVLLLISTVSSLFIGVSDNFGVMLTSCIGIYSLDLLFEWLLKRPILKNIEYITHHGIFKNYLGKLIPQSAKVKKKSQPDELTYWFELFKQGAITQEEYEDKKSGILQTPDNQPARVGKIRLKKD